VLDGDPAPTPKGEEPTQFSAHVYFGQTVPWIKMPLGTVVDLGLRDIVFDVDPATPRKKGTSTPTQFLAHVYCGQMAGWMKTPLGTDVDLGSGHIVLDGSQLSRKGHSSPPIFGPCLLWLRSPISATAELLLLWPNGWMHQDGTRYGGRPQPRRLCVRRGPSLLSKKGRSPRFSANVYCGQTAAWIKMPLGMR